MLLSIEVTYKFKSAIDFGEIKHGVNSYHSYFDGHFCKFLSPVDKVVVV